MEKPAITSEQLYFFHLSRYPPASDVLPCGSFKNPLPYMYQWIIFSTIECAQPGLSASVLDVLPVNYCYQLLILDKNVFQSSYSRHHVQVLVCILSIFSLLVNLKLNLVGLYSMNIILLYKYIFNILVHSQSLQKMSQEKHLRWDHVTIIYKYNYFYSRPQVLLYDDEQTNSSI